MEKRMRFLVSAEFPTRFGQVLLVRDGDGRTVERIHDCGETKPFKTSSGQKKHWDVSIETVRSFAH